MAAGDARTIPRRAQAYRATFPIYDDNGDVVADAADLDSVISKDGGTFGACTNEATQIATSSGIYYLDLTSAEMTADTVAIKVQSSTTNSKDTVLVFYPEGTDDLRFTLKKNQARNNFALLMRDSTNHNPATGKSVTGTVSKDGAAFGALTNSVTEIANGWYKVNLDAADTNADVCIYRFTATGCDDTAMLLYPQD